MILWDSLKVASLEDTVPRWLLGFLRNGFLYVLTDWISTCAPPKQNRQQPKHRVFHEMPAFLPEITTVIRSNPSLPKDDTTILLPKKWPPKTMTIRRGPVMLFVMTCRLRLGSMMQLHFFEPRYRYMCRHLTVGGRFGFMNGGRCTRGCTGVLCEVMEARFRRCCDGVHVAHDFSPFLL